MNAYLLLSYFVHLNVFVLIQFTNTHFNKEIKLYAYLLKLNDNYKLTKMLIDDYKIKET